MLAQILEQQSSDEGLNMWGGWSVEKPRGYTQNTERNMEKQHLSLHCWYGRGPARGSSGACW